MNCVFLTHYVCMCRNLIVFFRFQATRKTTTLRHNWRPNSRNNHWSYSYSAYSVGHHSHGSALQKVWYIQHVVLQFSKTSIFQTPIVSKDRPKALKRDSIYKKGFRRLFTFTIKALTCTFVPVRLVHFTHSTSIV